MNSGGPRLSNASLYRTILTPFFLFALLTLIVTLVLLTREQRSQIEDLREYWGEIFKAQHPFFENELFLNANGAAISRSELMMEQLLRRESSAGLCVQLETLTRQSPQTLFSKCAGPNSANASLRPKSPFFTIMVGSKAGARLYYHIALPLPWLGPLPVSLLIAMGIALLAAVVAGWYLVHSLQQRVVRPLLQSIEHNARLSAMAEMATQVAHDIRAPLSALNVVNDELSELPEAKRDLVRGAIRRIQDIASHLLESKTSSRDLRTAVSVAGAAESILAEKRMQYRDRPHVQLTVTEALPEGHFALVQPIELKRMISNLIDNAVQAVGQKGRVEVSVREERGTLRLSIQDDGCGIEKEVLPKLMTKGATFKKSGGSGLGLYHARTTAESWGGDVDIQSTPGSGTTVTVSLPAFHELTEIASRPDFVLISPPSPL